jgi:hypothetical protein
MTPELRKKLCDRRWRDGNPSYINDYRKQHSLTPEQLDRKNKYFSGWYRKNLDAQRERSKKWRRNHPVEVKQMRITLGLKKIGWSSESKAAALVKQDNRCAICDEVFTDNLPARCDHEHVTPPKPRGLLCNRCNVGIGMLLESPERCEAASRYLRSWQGIQIPEEII